MESRGRERRKIWTHLQWGKCVRQDDFQWSSAYISVFIASVWYSFRFFFFILKLLLGNENAPMVLGGKMKMIDVSNSFILKNKKREKKSLFLFIFFILSRCNGHAFSILPGWANRIPDRRQWKSNLCACLFVSGRRLADISISNVSIKKKKQNGKHVLQSMECRFIQSDGRLSNFHRFN